MACFARNNYGGSRISDDTAYILLGGLSSQPSVCDFFYSLTFKQLRGHILASVFLSNYLKHTQPQDCDVSKRRVCSTCMQKDVQPEQSDARCSRDRMTRAAAGSVSASVVDNLR